MLFCLSTLRPNLSFPWSRQRVKLGGMMFTNSAEFLQSSLGLVDGLDPFLRFVVSCLERLFERGQPWVESNNALDNQLSVVHWELQSLPVPSFGIPLAAPWSMSELLECSFVLSIVAGLF